MIPSDSIVMNTPVIDVIIPVCKPDEKLVMLLKKLGCQTVPVSRIIIMNTGREFYNDSLYEGLGNISVTHLDFSEFDHGKTRHEGIMQSEADYCLLMTQDAVPANEYLVENLLKAFDNDKVAVAYARQLPNDSCRIIERLAREFNYPAISKLKLKDDIKTMGIKAFFCSDVCAMYNRKHYIEQGGFIRKTIFNEDMIMAYKFLMADYGVYYCGDAKVIHSHNYSNMDQLHRNFDLGVSQTDNPEIFGCVSSESEGVRYIKRMTGLLFKNGAWYYIPYFYINSAFRLVGYKLGKGYKKLPKWLVRACSMNVNYWRQQ